MRDLIPPKPVFIESSKAVDNDGYGEGEAEHPWQGAEPRKHLGFSRWLKTMMKIDNNEMQDGSDNDENLPQKSLRTGIISHCGDRHKAPPFIDHCVYIWL